MIEKLRHAIKGYFERNEKAHLKASMGIVAQGIELEQSIPDLPRDIVDSLKRKPIENLYVLEIINDDLTPSGFVVALLQKYCLLPPDKALYFTENIHENGSSQVLSGPEQSLKIVAEYIEKAARNLGYPLKCRIIMV